MKALTWQGTEKVTIEEVPDPRIEKPTDAIIKVTSTAICGSDMHLYKVLGPFLKPGDILGHEPMGIVEEVGPEAAGHLKVGDRVVVPFNVSCGHCWMCTRGLQSQCETTADHSQDKGAALLGYTSMYGAVPGGQAEYLRVPQAQYGPIVVPADGPDERFLYLSDILPTAWQAVQYGGVEKGSTVAVVGLGPVGQLAARAALYLGAERVIGIDLVTERLGVAAAHGVETVDARDIDGDVTDVVREMTNGRGVDVSIEAVGMEAHGNPVAEQVISMAGKLPDPLARKTIDKVGIDRLDALLTAIGSARRGGTVSISGVYGGAADPLPMLDMFDRQLTLRMGQTNVKRWTDDLLRIISTEGDVFGLEGLATDRPPLVDAPEYYEKFQKKQDGCLKVVLKP
ncbi:zinc-dependent alcohol dehydrogenase [Mobilicoccus pelagius]|uniref:Putative glutathione-dependent formaldehyde dehydrogenase n=1 Tax=Mobilicoccus pelagius NBRC 104925 TaxID=1089455 RepID=H5UVI7_9MICO|nr:zinc-dependent alcohol dehydrogenase [Mobilicoccus pelagius]GAB49745.1 putative glutathione-dependent formaldehyde dehydrogenase [Mobilicoccus pelagius NBRC 104925]